MPAGRPPLVDTPDQLFKWFKNYVVSIKANPIKVHDFVGKDAMEVERRKERPLTMEGFENYVYDVGGPVSLEHYFANSDNKYEQFCTICRAIKREIRADQIEGGMTGIYNPSITQRLNGLSEKTEHSGEIKTGTPIAPIVNIYSTGPSLSNSEDEVDEIKP